MKKINKIVSILLSLALCFTAIYTGFTMTASAETVKNSIINGDFATGTLFGYDVSENKSHNEAIAVKDEVCYIPESTATNSDDKSYNRFINQKVALENGKYIFSFDVDATFTQTSDANFGYAIRRTDATGAYQYGYKRPTPSAYTETGFTVSKPVLSAISPLNKGDATTTKVLTANDFVAWGAKIYYLKGVENTRYTGKVSVILDVNNTESATTEFWFSIGLYNPGASVYIDNISLEKATVFNGDFSNGLSGYDLSAVHSTSTNEPISVDNGVCCIPENVAGSQYNRWVNQTFILENGKYVFSFDVDSTNSKTGGFFGYAIRRTDANAYDTAKKMPTTAAYTQTGFTTSAPILSEISPLNINDTTEAVALKSSDFKAWGAKIYTIQGTIDTRYTGRVSVVVDVNNTESETTEFRFSLGTTAAGAVTYIDNISVERLTITNGDFSNGLSGYDISAVHSTSTNEPISVDNGVCYIPENLGTSQYNRWVNQTAILENGKYVFSFDVDSTNSKTGGFFGYAIRRTDANAYDTGKSMPTTAAYTQTGFTTSAPILSEISPLNINDTTEAVVLKSSDFVGWAAKIYYINGKANTRYIGRVSIIIDVNNTESETTEFRFSLGATAAGAATYIDNISVEKFASDEVISNGDFETGKDGYLYADDSASQINIYDNADTTRPGYGTVELDGKAVYLIGGGDSTEKSVRKNYHLQYKMANLPAGQYTIRMDVLFNMIDTSSWSPLAFGITDAFDSTNGLAYGKRLINSTGDSSDVQFTDYTVRVTENGKNVSYNKSHLYHRIGGWALPTGWHDLDISVNFKITEDKTLYFFVFCGGDATEAGMDGTAYVDNISFYESATMQYSPVNVKGELIPGTYTTVDFNKVGSIASKPISDVSNYNLMGYRIGTDGEIVSNDIYETVVNEATDISFVYALQGDLNDDLYVNALDLTEMRKYLLEVRGNYNIVAADASGDGLTDIRDLVALKKKLVNLSLEDKKIVNANIEQMRDPYMFVENDVYYLYGTGGKLYKNTSRTLSGNWQYVGDVVEKPEMATDSLFWAPEVYKYNNEYYMITSYYSSLTENRGCAIFKSSSPEGPFVQISNGTITPADKSCIDGTLYIDKENQPWLVYSEEYIEAKDNVGAMYAAKLSADLTSLISDPIKLFGADKPSWSSGKVTEGPYMYRCENGELLMLVSGFQLVDGEYRYCVGISRSYNGEIDGMWTHYSTLLCSKEMLGEYDGGHGMIFESLTGQLYLAIHSPNDVEGVNEKPVFIPIKEENNTLVWDVK